MAMHEFICDECDIVLKDNNTRGVHLCPRCNCGMRWNVCIGFHGNYAHPVHSDALAINPEQAEEHKQKFPNIELDGQCRPVFNNFVNHQAYLDATGFVKTAQKLKPKKKATTNA